jgi:hypothetical protein
MVAKKGFSSKGGVFENLPSPLYIVTQSLLFPRRSVPYPLTYSPPQKDTKNKKYLYVKISEESYIYKKKLFKYVAMLSACHTFHFLD